MPKSTFEFKQVIKISIHFILYRVIMRNFLRLIFGISFRNSHHIKDLSQFIIIANHNSHMDTISILSALPSKHLTKVHPVAAGDYFGKNVLTTFISTFIINTILITRKKSESKNNTLDEMDLLLKQGKSLLIFPEGSRGEAEVMQEFKHGVSILAKKNPSIPIIPIFLKGMGKALPKGDPFLIPMECEIIIGQALVIDDIENLEIPHITQLIKDNLLKLREN